jgi:HSP20 family protein
MSIQPAEKDVPVAVKNGASPIQAFQNEVNKLFGDFFGETLPHWWRASETCMPFGVCPATDIVETDKDFKVTAELPGLDAKDIAVTVSDGYVTIRGEKKEESGEEKNGYFRQERSYGEFQRIVALPPHLANMEKAEANMSKGLLTVTVPKKASTQSTATRKLEVRQAA